MNSLPDGIGGALGALVATLSFYPFDIAKVQVQSSVDDSEKRTLMGSRTLAKLMHVLQQGKALQGCPMKCTSTLTSSFIYFYAYAYFKRVARRRQGAGKTLGTGANLLCAALAGVVNVCLTLPLDQVCTRMQVSHQNESMSETVSSLREEGYQRFWRGLVPSLVLVSNPAINYTAFDVLKTRYLKATRGTLAVAEDQSVGPAVAFILAAVAKTLATLLTYPLIRAKVVMMARRFDSDEETGLGQRQARLGLVGVLLALLQRDGLRGCYRGMGGQVIHTMGKSAVLLTTKEFVMSFTRQMLGLG
ncbi:unnamed protein product [Chrysoparadoxa australica]